MAFFHKLLSSSDFFLSSAFSGSSSPDTNITSGSSSMVGARGDSGSSSFLSSPSCCIAEGDLFMGEATLRKMRCRQEIRRGVTGVPPAFRDSLLQVDEVLFLPSPSLWKANKYVTCKENCIRWTSPRYGSTSHSQVLPWASTSLGQHGAMRHQAHWSPRPPYPKKNAIQAIAQS